MQTSLPQILSGGPVDTRKHTATETHLTSLATFDYVPTHLFDSLLLWLRAVVLTTFICQAIAVAAFNLRFSLSRF